MMDKLKKNRFSQIIFFLFFVFGNLFLVKETLAAPPPCAYGGCYLELNYPKYLHVSKPGVGELYKKYLGKGEFVGSEAVEKVYAETPKIRNMGLIWYPKEAIGKTVDVIIALHGIRSLGQPGNNEYVYSTADNFKKFDKIVREYMDKGLAEPVVVISPMYDKGWHDLVWDRKDVYNAKDLLEATKKAITAAKLNINFKRVSVLGHSNANCGGGLARTASELTGYNLYLYMAADGTCGETTKEQPVGIGPFFVGTNKKGYSWNVFDIMKLKGGYIFHMHTSQSDLGAIDEIKSTYKGGKDTETPTNGSQYNETWKSEDGKVFSYSLTSASGPYGAHDHTHLPQYLLAEVLPRFFGKKPYDPKANSPILENWTPGTKVTTSNQNPAQNVSIINDVFGNKQLTDSELQKFLQKPVPKIKIPGLVFSDITLKNLEHSDDDGTFLYFPFLGEYISSLYKYIIVVISIVAVIMLIIAGLQWMLPGGEAENISSAKKRIEQAIVGLIIAVSSYSILFIINPELVNFRSLRVRFIQPKQFELTAVQDDAAQDNYPVDTKIAKKLDSITEVTEDMFTPMQINTDKEKTDGWAVWNSSLSDDQKKEILPYLFKQIAKCPIDEPTGENLVNITDVPGWANKKIHPDALAVFQKSSKIANDLGFKLTSGSSFRDTDNLVTWWNTGVVGRYKQGIKEWKNNEGKISSPNCESPHVTGGAVDVNLYDNDQKKVVLAAADPSKITAGNYASKFLGDKYKIILEYIMNQAGWVRLCSEHWHFEYAVTKRYKAWEAAGKKSRCWLYTDSIEQPIPEEMKKIVNQTLKDKGKPEIFK